jgi:cobalt/nickel transport system permease protein/cobalt/nickel transport protein
MKITTKFWIGLGVLIILSPLGLLFPEYFKAGSAWGEWGADQMQKLVGYVPEGLENLSSLWNAPMPDYVFKGWEGKSLASLSLAYVLSAIVGILLVVLIVLLLGRILLGKEEK